MPTTRERLDSMEPDTRVLAVSSGDAASPGGVTCGGASPGASTTLQTVIQAHTMAGSIAEVAIDKQNSRELSVLCVRNGAV